MRKAVLFFIVAIVSFFVFSACSSPSDSNSQHKKEVEENQKLDQVFSAVKGTYQGELKTINGPREVKLVVYTIPENSGFNSDGSVRIRQALKGNFKLLSPPEPAQLFSAQFVPETASLNFISNNSNLDSNDVQSIETTVNGDLITGVVKRIGGPLGTLNLKLASRETDQSNQDDTTEYYDRLRRQYKILAGIYQARVTPPPQVASPFRVQLVIDVRENAVEGYSKPVLFSYLHREDDETGLSDLNMEMTYSPDLNPPRVSFYGKGQLLFFVNIQGTFELSRIRGVYSTQKFQTDVEFVRQ